MKRVKEARNALLILTNWEFDQKSCTGPWCAFECNRSTVGLHRVLYDRKTQAGSTRVSRSIFMYAIESLEDMRLVTQRYTGAIVVHPNHYIASVTPRIDANLDSPLAPMFERVIDKIEERLIDPKSISFDL